MQAATFSAGKIADFFLLVAALEIESSQIGACVHFETPDGNQVGAVTDIFEDGFVVVQTFSCLIDKGKPDGFADDDFTLVGLFLSEGKKGGNEKLD